MVVLFLPSSLEGPGHGGQKIEEPVADSYYLFLLVIYGQVRRGRIIMVASLGMSCMKTTQA